MSEGQASAATVATASSVNPANTHHVRQVLQQFSRHAPLSLTGPTGLEEQARSNNRFKLSDDVVLRKVYPGEADSNGSGVFRKNAPFEANGQVYEQLKSFAIQKAIAMRYQQEQFMAAAEKDRDRSRERQLSGRSRQNSGQDRSNHLSGEQIRKLRETQKAQERAKAEEERRLRESRADQITKDGSRSISIKSAFKQPQSVPNQTAPILSSNDKSWSELEDTSLKGEQISCFNVGGEYRLCLPQILNSVLEKVSLPAINQACDELQIFCSTCSVDQLQVLKDAKVLPVAAHQCGLITKSDAERLCSHLLDKNQPKVVPRHFDPKASPFSFKVQHECFGQCEGLVLPEAYTTPAARCVECLHCDGLFSPQEFVCHACKHSENRTCHWGFDSAHWRSYIQLSDGYTDEEVERHGKVMEDFKNRYNTSSSKRRQEDDHYEGKRDGPSHSKRAKHDIDVPPPNADPYNIWNNYANWTQKPSSFQSFPTYPGGPTPYSRGLEVGQDLRRDDARTSSPSERFRSESPHGKRKPSTPEKGEERFPDLAKEISSVAEALDGAPAHAKETVLKILQRLTLRLYSAERDRDSAIGQCTELKTRCEQLEEELSKKRGELRELLRQDSRLTVGDPNRREESPKSSSTKQKEPPLEDTQSPQNCVKRERRISGDGPEHLSGIGIGECGTENGGSLNEDDQQSEHLADSFSKQEQYNTAGGLPKNDLKSPVRNQEECGADQRMVNIISKNEERVVSTEDIIMEDTNKLNDEKQTLPKPKVPENLQERMIKMEAELTALREELSVRGPTQTIPVSPGPNTPSGTTSVIIKKGEQQ